MGKIFFLGSVIKAKKKKKTYTSNLLLPFGEISSYKVYIYIEITSCDRTNTTTVISFFFVCFFQYNDLVVKIKNLAVRNIPLYFLPYVLLY